MLPTFSPLLPNHATASQLQAVACIAIIRKKHDRPSFLFFRSKPMPVAAGRKPELAAGSASGLIDGCVPSALMLWGNCGVSQLFKKRSEYQPE